MKILEVKSGIESMLAVPQGWHRCQGFRRTILSFIIIKQCCPIKKLLNCRNGLNIIF